MKYINLILFVLVFGTSLQAQKSANDWYNEAKVAKSPDVKIQSYTKAIQLKPNMAYAYYGRGLAFYKKKAYEKAIADFTNTIKYKPTYANAYNYRGVVHMTLLDYDKAISDFTKAIEVKPSYANPYNYRGRIYLKQEEWDKAEADLSKAIEYKPKFAEAYNNRGYVKISQGCYTKAIDDLNKAIEYKSNFYQAYNNRGFAYQGVGRLTDAIKDYERCIEINPNFPDAHENLGVAKKRLSTWQPNFVYIPTYEVDELVVRDFEEEYYEVKLTFNSNRTLSQSHFHITNNGVDIDDYKLNFKYSCETSMGTFSIQLPVKEASNTFVVKISNHAEVDKSFSLTINKPTTND